ncbi:MAG: hypothetical protein OXE58_01345 [Acidobacteria bacterium]|nr:hypothetical protein [Acidobacteriota bacterium]
MHESAVRSPARLTWTQNSPASRDAVRSESAENVRVPLLHPDDTIVGAPAVALVDR